MKKIIATILCFVYVAASSGATVNFHYCMGKFIGWDIDAATQHTCSNCGMAKEKKQGCCNDKHAIVKVNKDQVASVINYVSFNFFVYVQHQYLYLTHLFFNNKDVAVKPIHAPPLLQTTPSFIFNCIFRI